MKPPQPLEKNTGAGMKNKFIEFDFLRALAIVSIVLYHLRYVLPDSLIFGNPLIYGSFRELGLGIFSFASGYLISYHNPEFPSFDDIKKFYKKRITRLFPLYWLAIVCVIGAYFVFATLSDFQEIFSFFYTGIFEQSTLIIYILDLQIFTNPVRSVFWYVSFILVCYACYPVIKKLAKSDEHILLVSFLIVGIFGLLRIFFDLVDDRFFIYFFLFIGGIIVNNRKILEMTFSKNREAALVILTGVLILINYLYFGNPLIKIVTLNLAIIVFCILLVLLLRRKTFTGFTTRFEYTITFIAVGSYAVYLFHGLILELGNVISIKLGLTPLANEIFTLFLIVPIIFIVGYYLQLLDNRIMKKIIKN
jgi:peptidoglycan/LPS O-acetylase OafA/YrhL